MSVRENIANNIVTTLQAITSPVAVKYVTREPFAFDKLSNAQFPAILVRSAGENREDSSLGGSITQRMATIDYELVCFVKGSVIDTARNNIIEAVEEGLDVDRLRGANALDTQITNIEIDQGSIDPIGGVIITVRVLYQYTRGTT
ncbi:hypothetical protein [Psychrobacter submarinus]|jgi:hypothetical protein|uniref:hypothetical protein n=1 Tax=Psychrobacter submarinus TaxID=154108 RepID=UPI003F69E0D4